MGAIAISKGNSGGSRGEETGHLWTTGEKIFYLTLSNKTQVIQKALLFYKSLEVFL